MPQKNNNFNVEEKNKKNVKIIKEIKKSIKNKENLFVEKTIEPKKEVIKKTTALKTTKKAINKSTTKIIEKNKTKTSKSNVVKVNKHNLLETKKENSFLEYYDLPYRYNETIVKSLFQKPKTLFVYWDISDSDKTKYIKKYGANFFQTTIPILKITNKTKNYYFEIEINDFANSWYFDVKDANCEYIIELGRYVKNKKYIKISISEKIKTPNDHILFETFKETICFKNIKTNKKTYKNENLFQHLKKDLNVEKIYNSIYKTENILDLNNPSSNNPTSTF